MAMHPLVFRIFSFVLFIVVSAGFIAVGRWTNAEHYAPWLVRGLDVNSWRFKAVGIWMALFGVAAAILAGWIHWSARTWEACVNVFGSSPYLIWRFD
jgi:uncharacterized membrane protein YkvI